MKLRIARLVLALVVSVSLAQCNEIAYPAKFTVKVMDEEGNAVPDTDIDARTFLRWEPGQSFGTDIMDHVVMKTNEEGIAVFEHKSKRGSFSIDVKQSKSFYRSSNIHYEFEEVRGLRWKPENPTLHYVLKKKRNPIPLYAKICGFRGIFVPEFNKTLGYDFQKGDWVQPYGKGVHNDIYFHTVKKIEDQNNFDNSLYISFPNEKDGILLFEDTPREGSIFASDYLAPLEGYEAERTLTRIRKNGKLTSTFDREKANYYLRLRTKLDEDGNIVSAHYGKIYGEFFQFTHYFNPIPNDRNLEFDPQQNLFPHERVKRP